MASATSTQLLFDQYQIILPSKQRHVCEQLVQGCYLVCTERESNQQPQDHQSGMLMLYHQASKHLKQLPARTFNQLDKCASSPGKKVYCYAKLAIRSPTVAMHSYCRTAEVWPLARLSWRGELGQITQEIF